MNNLLFVALLMALLYYFFFYLPSQKKSINPHPTKLTHSQSTQTDPHPSEILNCPGPILKGPAAIKPPEDTSALESTIDQLIKSMTDLAQTIK